MALKIILALYFPALCFAISTLKQEDLKSIADGEAAAVRFEPQVALLCDKKNGQTYYNQFMSESGTWTTDIDNKPANPSPARCIKEKLDVLDYCKKAYPTRQITNIVEGSKYVKISNWCKVGRTKGKCKRTEWVKPYRCLEGPFQSDALLVPEKCVFDHIHNQSRCWPFDRWNQTASLSCNQRSLQIRSFAMLMPCGISLFSGVEFVCCPKEEDLAKKGFPTTAALSNKFPDGMDEDEDDDLEDNDDDEDDDEMDDNDEEYENYEDNNVDGPSSTSTTTTSALTTKSSLFTTTPEPTPDPYFTFFDPTVEHKLYKEAQLRLEEQHREKIGKVMKDWAELEERYQGMRVKDPNVADDFKKRMTLKFKETVQALEDEKIAGRHQLIAMHQQRINAHINQRKKESMNCYNQALNENPPNTRRVQKCLQKLLRSLHKDRHHTLEHYRHILMASLDEGDREKDVVLEHLLDIDRTVNESLKMLDRYPSVSDKISQLMTDYVQALRMKDNVWGSQPAVSREEEIKIMDMQRDRVIQEIQKMEEFEKKKLAEEKEMQRKQMEAMKMAQEDIPVTAVKTEQTARFDPETMENEHGTTTEPSKTFPPQIIAIEHRDTPPIMARAMTHDLTHGEPIFAVKSDSYGQGPKNLYFTIAFSAFALIAVALIGVVVIHKRNANSPQNQGFIEVNQGVNTEEKHVCTMQINGYENPTYRYFEVKK